MKGEVIQLKLTTALTLLGLDSAWLHNKSCTPKFKIQFQENIWLLNFFPVWQHDPVPFTSLWTWLSALMRLGAALRPPRIFNSMYRCLRSHKGRGWSEPEPAANVSWVWVRMQNEKSQGKKDLLMEVNKTPLILVRCVWEEQNHS